MIGFVGHKHRYHRSYGDWISISFVKDSKEAAPRISFDDAKGRCRTIELDDIRQLVGEVVSALMVGLWVEDDSDE